MNNRLEDKVQSTREDYKELEEEEHRLEEEEEGRAGLSDQVKSIVPREQLVVLNTVLYIKFNGGMHHIARTSIHIQYMNILPSESA